jgi:hypothetical protein
MSARSYDVMSALFNALVALMADPTAYRSGWDGPSSEAKQWALDHARKGRDMGSVKFLCDEAMAQIKNLGAGPLRQ